MVFLFLWVSTYPIFLCIGQYNFNLETIKPDNIWVGYPLAEPFEGVPVPLSSPEWLLGLWITMTNMFFSSTKQLVKYIINNNFSSNGPMKQLWHVKFHQPNHQKTESGTISLECVPVLWNLSWWRLCCFHPLRGGGNQALAKDGAKDHAVVVGVRQFSFPIPRMMTLLEAQRRPLPSTGTPAGFGAWFPTLFLLKSCRYPLGIAVLRYLNHHFSTFLLFL